MSVTYSIASFFGGALAVALINEMAARLFGAPHAHAAIADMTIARTKHRAHRSVPVSDSLRQLLADGPTEHVDWDATFMCEHDIDLSVLELIGREKTYADNRGELEARRARIAAHTVRDEALSLGRNIPLIRTAVNALIRYCDKAPTVPATPAKEEVFKLRRITGEKDGRKMEFVHLDLPGNPFPIVGSQDGRPENNEKTAALAYSLSYCDPDMLSKVLTLAIQYCDSRVAECKRLREEFERIKREKSYLEADILISNRGDRPVYVSTFANVTIGNEKTPIHMSIVHDKAPNDGKRDWEAEIRDEARRLSDWIPSLANDLRNYQSGTQTLAIAPSDTISLHFVSDTEVSKPILDAVSAMRTGYTDCTLTLWQYVPRKTRWLPWAARFVRRIRTVQKATSART